MGIFPKVLIVLLAFVMIPIAVGFFVFWGGGMSILVSLVTPQPQEEPATHLNSPDVVRGVYLTAYAASKKGYIDSVLRMHKNGGLNAVVIDIKDFSGYVLYDSHVPEVEGFHTKRVRIPDIRALTKMLHENGIYVIGRITVFQDPALSLAKPEWAIKKRSNPTELWTDYKGLAWLDPAAQGVWDYIVAISKDAVAQGFDELNFDYIRFVSDGDIQDTKYPFWDETTYREIILRNFFQYLRSNLPGIHISADLFGFVTTKSDDMGVGQKLEDGYENFDVVSPLVYPSHYPPGGLGFEKPAEHPYEVVNIALSSAAIRLQEFVVAHPTSTVPVLRPWLQDFNLGAAYDLAKVEAQIQATKDALKQEYHGFMLWNAGNIYTEDAFKE